MPGRPDYKMVDGLRVIGFMSDEIVRSAMKYNPDPDDIFVATFPKCGTHWIHSIVTLLLNRCSSELHGPVSSSLLEMVGSKAIKSIPSPKVIVTHLPVNLLQFSHQAKYIVVFRNPKDCCVSFYHHSKAIDQYNFRDGTFEEFFELFVEGQTDFNDYFDFMVTWYERRNDPNVLILTYESVKKDTAGRIADIARFLGVDIDPLLLENILKRTTIDSMRKLFEEKTRKLEELNNAKGEQTIVLPSNVSVTARLFTNDQGRIKPPPATAFVRKGDIGDWKNCFTEEQSRRMEEKFTRKTKGLDIEKLWADVDWMVTSS